VTDNITTVTSTRDSSEFVQRLVILCDSFQVGWYLKNPKYPIWLVGSETHLTVLFSLVCCQSVLLLLLIIGHPQRYFWTDLC